MIDQSFKTTNPNREQNHSVLNQQKFVPIQIFDSRPSSNNIALLMDAGLNTRKNTMIVKMQRILLLREIIFKCFSMIDIA